MTMIQPVVHPFGQPTQCPKCGADTDPASVHIYGGAYSLRYCAGGKELEAENPQQEPVAKPVAALLAMLAKQFPGASASSPLICAGVLTEHLHKTCGRCGYELLTECW